MHSSDAIWGLKWFITLFRNQLAVCVKTSKMIIFFGSVVSVL